MKELNVELNVELEDLLEIKINLIKSRNNGGNKIDIDNEIKKINLEISEIEDFISKFRDTK